ncbi:uncharacterized protein EDB91DRAFT_143358 [Suillus paluster]|uniref:uncharacterized protein n=1 Tax=Suillus paluster TaxID=48578 RepID=UPI001B8711B8|nr:uncharacterized protein EDB91DRAFT_143358 [Suillus paluster]KAG1724198.1 hypothetical protein EDB91DRAFT_143358 [Suillus paluster]
MYHIVVPLFVHHASFPLCEALPIWCQSHAKPYLCFVNAASSLPSSWSSARDKQRRLKSIVRPRHRVSSFFTTVGLCLMPRVACNDRKMGANELSLIRVGYL